MKKGFDANQDLTRFAAGLKDAGYDFVARYYNVVNHSKNLTLSEAKVLSNAGLGIVAVWENKRPTVNTYFTRAVGVYDGTAAYHFAQHEIGQPANTPIYFAVDYDATAADVAGPITDYFKGIQQGFNTISGGSSDYNIGVYGSGAVCSALLDAGLATYAWLSMSGGFRGSSSFTKYNIKQSLQITACPDIHGGIVGDPDISPNNNEGSFTIPMAV